MIYQTYIWVDILNLLICCLYELLNEFCDFWFRLTNSTCFNFHLQCSLDSCILCRLLLLAPTYSLDYLQNNKPFSGDYRLLNPERNCIFDSIRSQRIRTPSPVQVTSPLFPYVVVYPGELKFAPW